jgi:transposase-like protein
MGIGSLKLECGWNLSGTGTLSYCCSSSKSFVRRTREGGKSIPIFSIRILPQYLRNTKEIDELIPFLYLKGISTNDFPAEHWRHIRSTNPTESTFATVKLRTLKTKGIGTSKDTLTLVFKMIQSA